jgi:nickel transport system ATP-binding protein
MNRLIIEGLRLETRHAGRSIELVHGIDLAVEAGSITALVGASGCGKSLSCLGLQNILPPGIHRTTGSAVIIEGNARHEVRCGHDVATVMQNPRSAFNPVLTMRAHGRETAKVARIAARDFESRLGEAVAEVGLDGTSVLDLYPFQMSGGMLQRMMIALALLSGAPFLIADEPTTDLDLVAQSRILDLLMRLVDERELGMLFITHDMGIVARIADMVAVMEGGRIVESGPVTRIFEASTHPATQALLEAHFALYPREAPA